MTRLILVAGLSMSFVAGLVSLPRTDMSAGAPPVTLAFR